MYTARVSWTGGDVTVYKLATEGDCRRLADTLTMQAGAYHLPYRRAESLGAYIARSHLAWGKSWCLYRQKKLHPNPS